jgi:hypothetical protein
MRTRCRHPRLASAACQVYRLTIWLYPREFRRAFGRELALTFRNRVEDVLDAGGLCHWLAFAAHIALDTCTTCHTLAASSESPEAVSLLGLSEGEIAHGGLSSAPVDIHMMFVTAGVALTFAGWFAFFVILPKYVC